MVAQDTGSAIVGPARADIYFGAGADAAQVAGRLKNNARFFMLVPRSLDPTARGRTMPLPDPRPSEKIARLFPQGDALKSPSKDQTKPASAVLPSPPTAVATAVPLPAARPIIAPSPEPRRNRHDRYYRRR
jgi:membrane-bound lytic murein transglycosylase A